MKLNKQYQTNEYALIKEMLKLEETFKVLE